MTEILNIFILVRIYIDHDVDVRVYHYLHHINYCMVKTHKSEPAYYSIPSPNAILTSKDKISKIVQNNSFNKICTVNSKLPFKIEFQLGFYQTIWNRVFICRYILVIEHPKIHLKLGYYNRKSTN